MFEKSIDSMLNAMETAELEGYKPKEGWYTLLAALYSELKPRIGEQVALIKQQEIYEILVNLYLKEYFITRWYLCSTEARTRLHDYFESSISEDFQIKNLNMLLLLNTATQ